MTRAVGRTRAAAWAAMKGQAPLPPCCPRSTIVQTGMECSSGSGQSEIRRSWTACASVRLTCPARTGRQAPHVAPDRRMNDMRP